MFCFKELDSSDIDANARFFASVATASTSHSAGEASLSSFSFPLVTWRGGGGGGGRQEKQGTFRGECALDWSLSAECFHLLARCG